MIPRHDGETLLGYLDRLTLMADERASLQVRFEALGEELATATMADEQLTRYLGLIESDVNASMSGIEASIAQPETSASTVIALMQSAYSEFNGGSNSETNDHAAQAQDHAAQAEMPSSTAANAPAISPIEPANSETNSEIGRQDLPTDVERIRTWALAQAGQFDAADACRALNIVEKSCGNYLGQLVKRGDLQRLDGTGKPGIPSRYRVAVTEPEQEEEAPFHLERSRLSLDQRLFLEHLEKHGAMTQKLACAQLNWANSRADRAINELTRGGLIGRRGGTLVAIPPEVVAAD